MTLSELLKRLDDHAVEDAASALQIAAVRSALVAVSEQPPDHSGYRRGIQGAARLVADTWPYESELGALVLAFSEAVRRDIGPYRTTDTGAAVE
ncbi:MULTISPECIES: hypothetical protein [unclassified Curtobacterium]|uniref:hypothetical protein n=1 Tax=unclassified Curtobacterium TaxID=257496 RepID=UPI000D941CE8|nr:MULTISPECIES: hypothetical protein [unclassified Curtobacterium]PYY63680.1 hypothetical protein DEJ30_12260 [Curtobacterium sp. MCPF17_003]PZE65900.1 hypothetical protein DEJ27_14075 [Curtobacterium sp. MCPF17_018]PZF31619.1 hypothetical protein DEJ35_06365 [Curtobacterium sp. MCPF17_051]WIB70471.1 hypothetical protein DEI85_15175 [Curtobacterium sp. MCBD17_026]